MNVIEKVKNKSIILAPMVGYSDLPFRRAMRRMGAPLTYTQMISANALIRSKGGEHMKSDEFDHPTIAQVCGNDPAVLSDVASMLEDRGFDGFDLNMGCPVRKVVGQGHGAALLKDIGRVAAILAAVRPRIKIPFSIKIRLGFDESVLNYNEMIHIASESGVDFVTIHGRTRAQGYSGHARWELIRDAKQKSAIPVVGNGDVITREHAENLMRSGFCDSVMIARAALLNPAIFRAEGGFLTASELRDVILTHFEEHLAHYGQKRAIVTFRKYLIYYLKGKGIQNRKAFFKTVLELSERAQVHQAVTEFLENVPHPLIIEQSALVGMSEGI